MDYSYATHPTGTDGVRTVVALGQLHSDIRNPQKYNVPSHNFSLPFQENDVCRFWELGGDAREGGIFIGDPVSEYSRHGLVRFSVFIVLDLSKPISIWPVFQSILPKLKRSSLPVQEESRGGVGFLIETFSILAGDSDVPFRNWRKQLLSGSSNNWRRD